MTPEQFTAKVKQAVEGRRAAADIQRAVRRMLRSYGI
jgi:hypothetical protein